MAEDGTRFGHGMIDTGTTKRIESSAGKLVSNPTLGRRQSAIAFGLALVLLLASLYRFVNLDWDQDQHLHPDERYLTMVVDGLKLPDSIGQYFNTATSPLNPDNRGYSGFVYGTFPVFAVKLVSELSSYAGYNEVTLLGRAMSALMDVVAVALLFVVGRKLYGTRVALLGSLLLAASVTSIQQSHFFTVDTFTNVPVLIAFLAALWIVEGAGVWAFALGGAAFGLSVAGRINMLPLAAILVLAGALRLARLIENTSISFAPAGRSPAARERGNGDPNEGTTILRTVELGPLSVDILRKPPREARFTRDLESGTHAVPLSRFWEPTFNTLFGLLLAATAAILVFRVAQPYAFTGLFGLNPKWMQTMSYIGDLVGGNIDYPPSHQWTDTLPYAFPFYNMVWWGLGIPLGIAAWAGFALAGYELIRHQKWQHLLVFFWVGGMFLYFGQQFAKTLRYSYPIIPFLDLLAAYLIIRLWDRASLLSVSRRLWGPVIRVAALAVGAVVVGYTLFYATAWIHIYQTPVTRVAATRWIYATVPCGSVVGNERWDDPLPLRLDGRDGFSGCYTGVDFENYAEDDDTKRQQMLDWIDRSDYIFISSNRLYVSIPRLPLRYPMTTRYYEWLFDGTLGFDLAAEFTSYPQVGPFVVNDDNAEEIFKNYEHPKVLIYKKSSSYSRASVAALLNSVDLSQVIKYWPKEATASRHEAIMTPVEAAAQRAGGTWLDIYHPQSILNQHPVVSWILVIELLGFAAFPITFLLFRGFFDRGFSLAKTLGILLPAWGAWTAASYRWLPFSLESILAVVMLVAAASVVVVWIRWDELVSFLRSRWRLLLLEEILWVGFFTFFLLIRFGNPDLWHPWYGGEKPMDFAYLNAIAKSTYFPPTDPWFAGGYINYYYFGQLISAALLRLTGIVPELAYNLLLPMFFAMLALGAFTVVMNIVLRALAPRPFAEELDWQDTLSHRILTRAVLAGVFSALLVGVIGNLGEVRLITDAISKVGEGGIQSSVPGLSAMSTFAAGVTRMVLQGRWFDIPIGWYYWNATRTIPDTVNEFPFFTFLYADLHAHLMALPFTLMALALALHAILVRARLNWFDLVFSALIVGSLRAINTWDYPTYLLILSGAIVIGYFAEPRLPASGGRNLVERLLLAGAIAFIQLCLIIVAAGLVNSQFTIDLAAFLLAVLFAVALGVILWRLRFDLLSIVNGVGWPISAIVVLALLLYAPFMNAYGTAYTAVELWKGAQTTLDQYLTVHGIFLFIIASFLVLQAWQMGRRQGLWRALSLLVDRPSRLSRFLRLSGRISPRFEGALEVSTYFLLTGALVEIGLLILNQPVAAVALPFAAIAAFLLLRTDSSPLVRFLSLLILAAVLMTVMVEYIVLKGDVGRMNTVFKFYLQVWVFFSVAGAAGLAAVIDPLRSTRKLATRIWWGAFAVLLAGGMVYPVFAGWAKISDRYPIGDTAQLMPTLNGMDYMKMAVYEDQNQKLTLSSDYAGIQWLRQNVKGSPIIAEANAPLYHWGSRISIYTGLPTIIGWDWHEKQQRSLLPGEVVDRRLDDVRTLFSTTDPAAAATILRRYSVSYIYVGEEERAFYPAAGLSKFDAMAKAGWLQAVYRNGPVVIYLVKA